MHELGKTREVHLSPLDQITNAADQFTRTFSPIDPQMRMTPLEIDIAGQHWKTMWFLGKPNGSPDRVLMVANGQENKAYCIYQEPAGALGINDHPGQLTSPSDFAPEDYQLPPEGEAADALRSRLASVLQTVITEQG